MKDRLDVIDPALFQRVMAFPATAVERTNDPNLHDDELKGKVDLRVEFSIDRSTYDDDRTEPAVNRQQPHRNGVAFVGILNRRVIAKESLLKRFDDEVNHGEDQTSYDEEKNEIGRVERSDVLLAAMAMKSNRLFRRCRRLDFFGRCAACAAGFAPPILSMNESISLCPAGCVASKTTPRSREQLFSSRCLERLTRKTKRQSE